MGLISKATQIGGAHFPSPSLELSSPSLTKYISHQTSAHRHTTHCCENQCNFGESFVLTFDRNKTSGKHTDLITLSPYRIWSQIYNLAVKNWLTQVNKMSLRKCVKACMKVVFMLKNILNIMAIIMDIMVNVPLWRFLNSLCLFMLISCDLKY